MSSSVFYRFRSQKDLTRLPFDGTGITVFEVKRQIIQMNGLGDGNDFDLLLLNEENEEYKDDTTIIPRASTVIAQRRPPARPGHGKAARYVTGKAPVVPRSNFRTDASKRGNTPPKVNGIPSLDEAQTEEERAKAIMGMDAANWEQTKQEMAKYASPSHNLI